MANFNVLYNSFEEFYSRFFQGNEIEFRYKDKCFYIVPHYNRDQIVGVCFGEAYANAEQICLSCTELYNASANGEPLGKILPQIDVFWNNI